MTPQEIAEVRPRLVAFAAEMLGGLPRKDQRAYEFTVAAGAAWRIAMVALAAG